VTLKKIQEVIENGFATTHYGVIFHSKKRTPADINLIRAVFRAVEAASTFVFWAMYSIRPIGSEPYIGEHLCIWGWGELEWDGLCTHNPLMEPLGTDALLTEAQLAAKYMDQRAKSRLESREFRRLNPEGPRKQKRDSYARRRPVMREKANKQNRQKWAKNVIMKRLRAEFGPQVREWREAKAMGYPTCDLCNVVSPISTLPYCTLCCTARLASYLVDIAVIVVVVPPSRSQP
jgi:hypothetical protein